MSDVISAGAIRDRFDYDPVLGEFFYKRSVGKKMRAGSRAGSTRLDVAGTTSYKVICIDGRSYISSRLVILYLTGQHPINNVHYRNGRRDDITPYNILAKIELGPVGDLHQHGIVQLTHANLDVWVAQTVLGGNVIHIGLFDTKLDAENAKRKFEGTPIIWRCG